MRQLNKKVVNDISGHPVRVLQFGEGNFLRAFVDWMIDVANEMDVTDMSVAVVSPRFKNNDTIIALNQQDGLYHVCLEGIRAGIPKKESRLIKCVADAISPSVDFEKYESYILSPELRFVVSNTTEAGIRYEEDDVLSDIPSTFPGKITSLLYKRYRHFGGDSDKGLIFLCCELIENNGSVLLDYVIHHAEEAGLEQGFVEWIRESCVFCDTLVDRIVSGFPSDDIGEMQTELGFEDNLIVKGELYHVWAIGGPRFEQVREELPLDKAGLNVLFMPSIRSFREKKVRLLNGSHTGMVPIALQLGCETVLDAFNRPDVSSFITRMVDKEVIPMIGEDQNEVKKFADGILERFYNPYIRHLLKSIALNSLSKWEARNFPTVRDWWQKGRRYAEYQIFTFASLMALYAPDSTFEPTDDVKHLSMIRDAWAKGGSYEEIVRRIVESGIFVENFEASVPGFSDRVARHLSDIRTKGMEDSLNNFLNGQL